VLYLDASALVKLILDEDESAALAAHIADRDVITCELALAEVPRAVARETTGCDAAQQEALLAESLDLLDALPMVRVNGDLLTAAGLVVAPARLRALDAIHLTAALSRADELDAFVTYDRRQAAAAATHELPVEAPA
jgi:predicted nucleic acid-binding protein